MDRMLRFLSSLCMMAEVDYADVDMNEENLDFADDILIDTITSNKLAFLVPLFEKILLSQDFDEKLKFSILSFLKRSISETFIKVIILKLKHD